MQLFSKQQRQARQQRLLSRVELSINRKQKRIADALNRRTQHWNKLSKLILLLLICLVFGGISLWLLIQAIN